MAMLLAMFADGDCVMLAKTWTPLFECDMRLKRKRIQSQKQSGNSKSRAEQQLANTGFP